MRLSWSIWVVLVLATSGCPDEGAAAADAAPPADCGVGLVLELRTASGAFAPVGAATDAELVLGFQGFRYVYARGHFAAAPGAFSAAIGTQLDGQEARSQPLGDLTTTADPAGGFVTEPWRVFFNDDPLPSLIDQGLTLVLYAGDSCQAGGHTVLRYDEGCYEGPDGARVCPDGGPAGPDGGP